MIDKKQEIIKQAKEFLDDVETTDNIDDAIFIMNDGTLVSGEFDCGTRGVDHNELKSYFNNDPSWEEIHKVLHIVRLVPESHVALINKGQVLNSKQKALLKGSSYDVEKY